MSGSLNLVVLVGRVGRDPETRFSRSGDKVVSISVATSEKWKGKDGQKNEHTEWHRVEIWGAPAEFVDQYVSTGSLVSIEGSIRTDEYTDKGGEKRKAVKIKAKSVQLLSGGRAKDDRPDVPTPRTTPDDFTVDDSDLPF